MWCAHVVRTCMCIVCVSLCAVRVFIEYLTESDTFG